MNSKQTRLSTTSYAVLSLVDMLGEATPYNLKRFLEKSIANFWHIPHTTFYAEAQRLAEGGHLSEEQETGGRRRKLYAVTARGREALQAWKETALLAPPELHEEGVLKIFAGADPGPVLRERVTWHRTKLAELETYLEDVRAAMPAPNGPERSLLVGIGYHGALVEQMELLLAGEALSVVEPLPVAAQAATGTPPAPFSG